METKKITKKDLAKLLQELYTEGKLSAYQVASQLGVSQRTIMRWMIKFSIPRRTRSEANSGNKHPNWKGGKKIDSHGYVLVHSPGHPNANNHGYVFEHRLVKERELGRYLTKEEVVHHNDKNSVNNKPKNLRLFENSSEHQRYEREVRE